MLENAFNRQILKAHNITQGTAMSWSNYQSYFESIPSEFLKPLFNENEYPWQPLDHLTQAIEAFFVDRSPNSTLRADRKIFKKKNGSFLEGSYNVKESEILSDDFVDPELNIFIGAGTLVEAGVIIKNHTIVEKNCEIRQGAYLRGYAFIGEGSVVGHTTEIKNSIFIKHVEAGHFAYIGDSIIGSYVNLGAGTKISNLQFRSYQAKKEEKFPHIQFQYEGKNIETGRAKFGAVIGDGCETGCNAVLTPFVFLGPGSWVMPNYCVLKGVYKRRSFLR